MDAAAQQQVRRWCVKKIMEQSIKKKIMEPEAPCRNRCGRQSLDREKRKRGDGHEGTLSKNGFSEHRSLPTRAR
jgi:hypothetical protein